ncbi:hypothetical protein BDN71DRAFT_1432614 [Pleurotus eryngii]|uniref:Uncharacterized protein n=1 Tax=Pleurotus eryngii TaxID=5323 RepID=A0A9P5ZTK7_PLEER|nr:hypothetical protein BDN71DRAFT_1432614 [Pleurotus eryngii]
MSTIIAYNVSFQQAITVTFTKLQQQLLAHVAASTGLTWFMENQKEMYTFTKRASNRKFKQEIEAKWLIMRMLSALKEKMDKLVREFFDNLCTKTACTVAEPAQELQKWQQSEGGQADQSSMDSGKKREWIAEAKDTMEVDGTGPLGMPKAQAPKEKVLTPMKFDLVHGQLKGNVHIHQEGIEQEIQAGDRSANGHNTIQIHPLPPFFTSLYPSAGTASSIIAITSLSIPFNSAATFTVSNAFSIIGAQVANCSLPPAPSQVRATSEDVNMDLASSPTVVASIITVQEPTPHGNTALANLSHALAQLQVPPLQMTRAWSATSTETLCQSTRSMSQTSTPDDSKAAKRKATGSALIKTKQMKK